MSNNSLNLINRLLLIINKYDFYLKILSILVLFYIIYNLNLKINKKNKQLCLIIPIYEIDNDYINKIYKNLEEKNYNFKIMLLKYNSLEDMNNAKLGHDINLAILLNNDSDYYCIQDYSVLPNSLSDYDYTKYPRFTSMLVKQCGDCSSIMGGSFIINKEDLIKTNGFINNSQQPLEDMKKILDKGFVRYLNCDIGNKCSINTESKEIILNNNIKKEEHIQNIRNSINTVVIDENNIKTTLIHIKNDMIVYFYNILNFILKLLGDNSKVKSLDYQKDVQSSHDNNLENYLHNNGLDQIKIDNIEDKIKNISTLYIKNKNFKNIYIINI